LSRNLFFYTAFAFFLFSGCVEHDVYDKFCYKEKLKVDCLDIEAPLDNSLYVKVVRDFGKYQNDSCDFTLKAYYYNVKKCDNPVANSVGSDFDGYVNLQIFYKGNCYYKIQQDYKGESWEDSYDVISKKLKKTIFN
jgi:hypothetical protein